jgi:hypothetical protein
MAETETFNLSSCVLLYSNGRALVSSRVLLVPGFRDPAVTRPGSLSPAKVTW